MKKVNYYLDFLVLTGLLGGIFGSTLLFFGSVCGILFIILARIWNKYIFSRFRVKGILSSKRARIGDKISWGLEIENKKILPVPLINVTVEMTGGIDFVNKKFLKRISKNTCFFSDVFNLKWYERVKRTYEIIPEMRGVYRFGPAQIFYRDILGIFKNNLEVELGEELVVYPRILPVLGKPLPLTKPFGTRLKEGWIFQERLNRVGIRPYQITDDIKQINWKASARHLKLESDIYKPSFDREVHFFLNIRTNEKWWEGIERNRLELAVICTASLINHYYQSGYQVGFYANGGSFENIVYTKIHPGKDKQHRDRLFTALARLKPVQSIELYRILQKEIKKIKKGSTLIIVSPFLEEEVKKIMYLCKKSCRIIFVGIGKGSFKGDLRGIETYYLTEEEAWDEIQTIKLVN